MKINELTSFPSIYAAQVRVVLSGSALNARTTVMADTVHQARAILNRVFGEGNVLSISLEMHESPVSSQIHRSATNGIGALHDKLPKHESDPVHASRVVEAGASTRVLSPQELQVKSLSDKAADFKQQAKMMKARQQVAKAQQKLMRAGQ